MRAATRRRLVSRQIPTTGGLLCWLDASTLGLADLDKVATWTDLSGVGNHLTEATDANRPVFKVNQSNGLAMVDFNGTSHRLARTFGSAVPQPATLIVVGASRVGNANLFDTVTGNANRWFVGTSSTLWSIHAGTTVSGGAKDTAKHIWIAEWNSTLGKLYIAGGTAVCSGNIGTNTLGGLQVGVRNNGTTFQNILVGEYLLYNRILARSEKNTLGAALGTKWGLTWNAI